MGLVKAEKWGVKHAACRKFGDAVLMNLTDGSSRVVVTQFGGNLFIVIITKHKSKYGNMSAYPTYNV